MDVFYESEMNLYITYCSRWLALLDGLAFLKKVAPKDVAVLA